MTDKLRAAAKAALETLDILSKLGNGDVDGNSKGNEIAQDARQNLRAALVETQMPTKICGPNLEEVLNAAGFYRKKEWVGLTDEEINLIYDRPHIYFTQYAKAIEAKLREKNG